MDVFYSYKVAQAAFFSTIPKAIWSKISQKV